jgi:nucleotide-binding universal stress UspA family protein
MLPEIKKILYATDLSENSRHAFSYAAAIADKFNSKITILHVFGDLSTTSAGIIRDYLGEERWVAIRQERAGEFKEIIQRRLDDFCKDMTAELAACPLEVEKSLVREGNPAMEIVSEAMEGNYDMVVLGTHGHGILADTLIGGTARRVVRRCKKPVTVVRLPEQSD